MESEQMLRDQLITLLNGGEAHMPLLEALKDFPLDQINTKPQNVTYSFWHLLEHIRFTQKDILDFISNPNYTEPEWPKEYWPDPAKQATDADWKQSVASYEEDMNQLAELVKTRDLYEKVAWGSGQIFLREILLVADHTAYHTGEFAILRQVEKNWPKEHE